MAYRRRNGRWNTVHNQNRIEQVWRVGIWKPAAGAAEKYVEKLSLTINLK